MLIKDQKIYFRQDLKRIFNRKLRVISKKGKRIQKEDIDNKMAEKGISILLPITEEGEEQVEARVETKKDIEIIIKDIEKEA